MVVLENCFVNNIDCQYNLEKLSINVDFNNTLHLITVISNPCKFNTRWKLAKEFINRIELNDNKNLKLYVVELVYDELNDSEYQVTNKYNPNHLQLRTKHPLWHKENMINICVNKLLPKDWKFMAWADADIEFENVHWVEDTIKSLQNYDIVQLFSHAIDMDRNKNAMQIFQGAAFQFVNKMKRGNSINYWHPGYSWGYTRSAYDKMKGLFDKGILGAGDDHMMRTLIGETSWITSVHPDIGKDYRDCLEEFAYNCKGLRIGYVSGVIKHHFHGSKKNRRYRERWSILTKYNFSPKKHMNICEESGLIIPSEDCPEDLLKDILEYFKERNEDE